MGQTMGPTPGGCEPVVDTCHSPFVDPHCAVVKKVHTRPFFDDINQAIDEASCLLLRASKEGDISGVKEALEAGADIDTRLPTWICINSELETDSGDRALEPEQSASSSFTPLMNASSEGHIEVLQMLLSCQADLELCDSEGMRALHLAAQAASVGCFRALLEAGADPLATDDLGRDALQYLPLKLICQSEEKQEWLTLLQERSGLEPQVTGTSEVERAEQVTHDAVVTTAMGIPWHSVPNWHTEHYEEQGRQLERGSSWVYEVRPFQDSSQAVANFCIQELSDRNFSGSEASVQAFRETA